MSQDLDCWLVLEYGQGANVDFRGYGCYAMYTRNELSERSGADLSHDETDFSGRAEPVQVDFGGPSENL